MGKYYNVGYNDKINKEAMVILKILKRF